jgi:hypothetical protein
VTGKNDTGGLKHNRIYPWLRVMLWLTPAGYLAISGAGFLLLANFVIHNPESHQTILVSVWVLLALAFFVAAGWCDHKLATDTVSKSYRPWNYILSFVLGQIILAPCILAAVTFAVFSFIR